jgi:outer membrane protein OmpA-like peptidoglycan-associated protein
MRRHSQWVTTLILASGMTLFSGCGARATKPLALEAPRGMPLRHIEQLDYGRAAYYAVCVEPACPTVTPKILDIRDASPPPIPPSMPATPTPPVAVPPLSAAPPRTDTMRSEDGSTSNQDRIVAAPVKPVIVHFKWNSLDLTDDAIRVLDDAMDDARSAARIEITGRTDNSGSADVNESVALGRAQRVRDYIARHLPEGHVDMRVNARGDCCFIAGNDTREGRYANRRVEVTFIPRREGIP